jgi:ADP-glucose pyrophosphorylase
MIAHHIESGARVAVAAIPPPPLASARVWGDPRARRTIIDKQVIIPAGLTIGGNQVADAARHTVFANATVVIGKRAILERA